MLYPIITNHYQLESAFLQKILALIHRTETQARDVFDLKLLIDQGATISNLPNECIHNLPTAIDNTLNISFQEFKSQVVAYLMQDYQNYYDSPDIWEVLQNDVITSLENLLKENKSAIT